MTRHPANRNLTLYFHDKYMGLLLQFDKAPFILQHLDRLYKTITLATSQYRRVFAFRLDLRFPEIGEAFDCDISNEVISRFIASFKAKISHDRDAAININKRAPDTVVRYAWTREVGQRGHPHFHLVILLNGVAYCSLGRYEMGRKNLFNRLHEAWASALGVPIDDVIGLVEFPRSPFYYLTRDNHASNVKFFYRASYLCKAATKEFVDGYHSFGTSRT